MQCVTPLYSVFPLYPVCYLTEQCVTYCKMCYPTVRSVIHFYFTLRCGTLLYHMLPHSAVFYPTVKCVIPMCSVLPHFVQLFLHNRAVLSISRRGINCFLRVTRANCSFCRLAGSLQDESCSAKKTLGDTTPRLPYGSS